MIDFIELKKHIIKGIMFHHDLAAYYDFLGFRGYKRCHEYHYLKESIMLRKLERHVMAFHHTLIEDPEFENPSITPSGWYNHNQFDVDESTRQNAVRSGLEEWVNWEKTFRDYMESALKDEEIPYADRVYIEGMLCDVNCEIKYAEKKHLHLEAAGYNVRYMLSCQTEIHDRYKEKTKKVGKYLC